jgi:hypothetical protein
MRATLRSSIEICVHAAPIDTLQEGGAIFISSFCRSEELENNQANLLQGTLDLLILKAIGDAEFHGLRISRRIAFRISRSSVP